MTEWHSKAKIRHKTNVPTPTKTKPGTEKTRKTTGLSNINPRSEKDNKNIRGENKYENQVTYVVYICLLYYASNFTAFKIHT